VQGLPCLSDEKLQKLKASGFDLLPIAFASRSMASAHLPRVCRQIQERSMIYPRLLTNLWGVFYAGLAR
jgi:hypothetical protein